MKSFNLRSVLILIILVLWILPVGCSCGGGGNSSTPSVSNVQPIQVNGGPTSTATFTSPEYSYIYPNGAFTSVTICVPGTSNCQTIDGVLVDTGSPGLRLLSSVVKLSLPAQTSGSSSIYECVRWEDLSYSWGPVVTADVQIAGEAASSVPIHLLGNTLNNMPDACSNGGTYEADDLFYLGANGILGIAPLRYDCGDYCTSPGFPSSPPTPYYYVCPSSGACTVPAYENLLLQVQNPVTLFSTDNNGVIIEFPTVSGPMSSLSGSLIFGIGTQSNNGLGSATVLTLFETVVGYEITTNFDSEAYQGSYIDSGSNGYFFPDPTLTQCTCPGNYCGFYCSAGTSSFTATNTGANGITSPIVNFSVGDTQTMPNDAVLNTLAGPNTGFFDWGLPFFYGRNVYVAIEGKSTPSVYDSPYFAY